ncbi:MAG: sensor histidine kinase [Gammaproteobacteria bacterium]|nr:sensor histidine kinase [Gammaproteobacteria bacterium]
MLLRHKLFIILTFLSVIPLLVLLFGLVSRLESEIRSRTQKELHVTLGKMSGELKLIIENQQSIALGLAQDLAVQQFAGVVNQPVGRGLSPRDYQQRASRLEQFFLNYQRAVPDIQALRYMDRSGKTLVKVKEGKPVVPKQVDEDYHRQFESDQSNKAFFKQALTHNAKVIMSDFEMGQAEAGAEFCPAMVRYTVRVKAADHDEGLLVVNMWGKRLDSSIEASMGGYPGQAYLVEMNPDPIRDGIYLYHKDPNMRFGDQLRTEHRFTHEVTPTEWRSIKTGKTEGWFSHTDGKMFFYRVLKPFITRPQVGWLLVISADTSTVLAPVASLRQSIWWLVAILLVLCLASAVWVAWRLTQPVHALAAAMKRYADGDVNSTYSDHRKDEIGVAAQAFHYLTSRLRATELERDKAIKLACQAEKLASVGQLAAGIGHEINNPLMNIMALAALVEAEVQHTAPQALGDIQLLQNEGKRCARIVQGILSFAREQPPVYREFDLAELIRETLYLLHHRMMASNIQTVLNLESKLLMRGDPSQLQQVLVNIILNAVQATPEGGEIGLHARKNLEYLAVEITDNGPGIDQAQLSKVFDPFFTTKTEGEGTGLGLSVSYGIVKRHGGVIYLENTYKPGLRVVILLPADARVDALPILSEQEIMYVA